MPDVVDFTWTYRCLSIPFAEGFCSYKADHLALPGNVDNIYGNLVDSSCHLTFLFGVCCLPNTMCMSRAKRALHV